LDAIAEHEKIEIVVGPEEIHEVDVDDLVFTGTEHAENRVGKCASNRSGITRPVFVGRPEKCPSEERRSVFPNRQRCLRARNAVLASNQRHVIQEAFLNHLSERGYRMEGFVWEADDRRKANHCTYPCQQAKNGDHGIARRNERHFQQ